MVSAGFYWKEICASSGRELPSIPSLCTTNSISLKKYYVLRRLYKFSVGLAGASELYDLLEFVGHSVFDGGWVVLRAGVGLAARDGRRKVFAF